MKRLFIAGFFTALILFPLSTYVFLKGAAWGVEQYKHSRQLGMTLDSMYLFGVMDACGDPDVCKGKK
jgi:hypothetical protein